MATKTEVAIQRIETLLATLEERIESIRRDVERLEVLPDAMIDVRERCTRVEEQVRALAERLERSDKYRWSLLGLVLGAILSFVANLVLLWMKP